MRRACLEARFWEYSISARRDERAANPEQRVSRFAGTRPKIDNLNLVVLSEHFCFLEVWELIQNQDFTIES
ncbi:hypothetical protein DLM77_10565 [Leptospira yasudae]|uniref:Uncharacterized protein n=1 Tax=Leptospira yasudae TaxID=2202201 RepID=A0ABX9M3U8_9LEPT|nr:hypothetical protein DLM77_10565 [Leptospira yasudae]